MGVARFHNAYGGELCEAFLFPDVERFMIHFWWEMWVPLDREMPGHEGGKFQSFSYFFPGYGIIP